MAAATISMPRPLPYPALIAGLALALAAAALASLAIGPSAAGLGDLVRAFGTGEADTAVLIMREIRLPRTLLGLMVGGTLGLAGAGLQGYLRNPLAEPGMIGVSGAASLGAVLAIYTGFAGLFPLALPALAIAGAALAALALERLAGRGAALTLVLAGVGVASLSGALTSLALNLSPNPYAALEIVFWIMGSLTDRTLDHVALAAPFTILGWSLLALAAPALDALSLGEEAAQSLGVDLRRTRALVIAGTAAAVGAATAVSGVIGFIGLLAPHFVRPLCGHRPSRVLLASALAGALLLLLADVVVRLVATGAELRIGVVTALVGAPFFLHLVMRARRELPA